MLGYLVFPLGSNPCVWVTTHNGRVLWGMAGDFDMVCGKHMSIDLAIGKIRHFTHLYLLTHSTFRQAVMCPTMFSDFFAALAPRPPTPTVANHIPIRIR